MSWKSWRLNLDMKDIFFWWFCVIIMSLLLSMSNIFQPWQLQCVFCTNCPCMCCCHLAANRCPCMWPLAVSAWWGVAVHPVPAASQWSVQSGAGLQPPARTGYRSHTLWVSCCTVNTSHSTKRSTTSFGCSFHSLIYFKGQCWGQFCF